jgi:uncharacterized membrane-anchored protein YhcB (DUF1043 family)
VNEQFWVQTAIYILTGLLAVARVGYVVGKIESKCATKEELEKAKTEGDEKRSRIYQRFDEYKAHLETNFVRREICSLMHNETAKAVAELTRMVKEFGQTMTELKEIIIKLENQKS